MWWILLQVADAAIVPASEVHFEVAVSGSIAEIEVRQTFRNEGPTQVDATYRFPLHPRAVVDGMQIRLEDRTIEGVILEKEEAREAYQQAVAAGKTAALTETVRWNLYQQQVGNIPPGAELEVVLRIVQPIDRLGRQFELSLPVGDAGSFGEEETLQPPADLEIEIDAGLPLRDVQCVTHEAFEAPTGDGWTVLLSDVPAELGPVVIRWQLADDDAQIGAVYDGKHVMLVFEPPVDLPLERRRALRGIVLFEPRYRGLAASLVSEMSGLDSFQLRESATPLETLLEVLEAPIPAQQTYVVLVTDGQDADEASLERIVEAAGTSKVFVVGGVSANRFALDEIASSTGGRAFYAPVQIGRIAELLARPTLSQIQIDWGDWGSAELAGGIQDVHLGDPVTVLARTTYTHGGLVEIDGYVGTEAVHFRIEPRAVAQGRALGSTWARSRIESLGRKQVRTGVSAQEEGLPLALAYGILSPWTAFVAIDPRVHAVEIPATRHAPMEPGLVQSSPVVEKVRVKSDSTKRRSAEPKRQRIAAPATKMSAELYRSRPEVVVGDPPLAAGALSAGLRVGLGSFSARGGLQRAGVGPGRWLQVPAALEVHNESTDGVLAFAHQRLSAPVQDAPDHRRDAVALSFSTESDDAVFQAGGLAQVLGCSRCEPRRTVAVDLSGARRWTKAKHQLALGGAVALGDFNAGADLASDRTSLAAGPTVRLSMRHSRFELRFDGRALIANPQGLVFVPTLKGAVGPRFGSVSLLVGGGQTSDVRRPVWGVPRTRRGWLGLEVGEEEAWLSLRSGWEQARSPLARRLESSSTLAQRTWSRQAWVTEGTFERSVGPIGFDVRARYTQVLQSNATLDTPTAPYVHGLLVAHRPLWSLATVRFDDGPTHLRVAGGVASPLPVGGWWGGWQAHAEAGVLRRFPLGSGMWGLGATGEVWSGRVGDADPSRLDGWVAPKRAGIWAVSIELSAAWGD